MSCLSIKTLNIVIFFLYIEAKCKDVKEKIIWKTWKREVSLNELAKIVISHFPYNKFKVSYANTDVSNGCGMKVRV